jgi:hypothetical protein
MKLRTVFILAIVCAGCSTVSDVVPIGKDTYMVGSEARGGFTSNTEVAELALKRANAYCAGLGKKMLLTNINTSGVQGWTPQNSQIEFQCLLANDPAFTRIQLQKEPNTVIEVKGQQPPL